MRTLFIAAGAVLSVFCVSIVTAQAAELTLKQKIEKCRTIKAERDRLTCYDVIGFSGGDGVAVPTEEPSAQVSPAKSREDSFGAERVEKSAEKKETDELDSIRSKVTKVVWSPRKQFAVYLENGQVWMQKDNQRVRFPEGDFTVEIEKGAFGSYRMIIPGKTSFVRVVRYK